jgi:CheY-like chemotaxis protein
VLLDIGLPGLDGHEVVRRLRAECRATPPFLVALTGYGRAEDRRRIEQAGIDLHLVKSADPERLVGLLKRFQLVVR